MGQRFDVKSTPANDDREFAARMNFADGPERKPPKFCRAHRFQDRHRADEMMRNFRDRGRVRFCGQQIESPINLKRVGADNFRAELARNIGRYFRFAGGGRADNEEDTLHTRKKTSNAQRPTLNLECSVSEFDIGSSAFSVGRFLLR
jgi:hypothetical protein